MVQARITFASADLLGEIALDRDGDGVVTDDDVAAARDDLRAFVLQGVGVDADGAACTPAFRDAALSDVDGLVLRATYACQRDAENIEVTLYYLSGGTGPNRRPPLRAIARIATPGATAEALLTGERRAIAIRLAGKGHTGRRTAAGLAALAVAAAVAGLLTFARRHTSRGISRWAFRRGRRRD